jgi:hypothetical protein
MQEDSMADTHRTDSNPARRDPRTGESTSRPAGTAGSAFNPSVHDIYWREAYSREPYYRAGYTYDDYAPAYRTGYEAGGRYLGQGKRFDDLDSELRSNYEHIKGKSRLAWEDAKNAARAAWHRVERLMPGDFDKDGR